MTEALQAQANLARKRRAKRKGPAYWPIVPICLGGFLVLAGVKMLKTKTESLTVSQVTRLYQDIATQRSTKAGIDDGGSIGPWWVTASRVDPFTGTFHDFRIRSGTVLIASSNAKLIIDTELDTFSFEMTNVVFTRVPDEFEDADPDSHGLHHVESHTLGPAPFDCDIVQDNGEDAAPPRITVNDLVSAE